MPLSPNPGIDQSWNGVVGRELQSPFRIEVAAFKLFSLLDTTTRAPLFAAPALLDARGFRSPPTG